MAAAQFFSGPTPFCRKDTIDLIGPAHSNGRWQQVQGNGFDISNFRVEWDREKVICPAGRERRSRYIGMGKTNIQRLATAAAINLKRVSDWLTVGDREM